MEYVHLKWYNQNVHNILLSENNFQIISNMQIYQFSQFSHLVMSDCLWLHGLQHARPPCPGVYSNSCPLRWWCYPPILSSVVPFSSHLQSSPAPGSFPMSQFFHIRWPQYWSFSFSISPSNEHSGLISVLPMNIQDWFPLGWLALLAVQGTLKSLLQHHSSKASVLRHSAFFIVQLSHPYMTTGKTKALTRWTFVGKVLSLLFNILFRLVITFLLFQGASIF